MIFFFFNDPPSLEQIAIVFAASLINRGSCYRAARNMSDCALSATGQPTKGASQITPEATEATHAGAGKKRKLKRRERNHERREKRGKALGSGGQGGNDNDDADDHDEDAGPAATAGPAVLVNGRPLTASLELSDADLAMVVDQLSRTSDPTST